MLKQGIASKVVALVAGVLATAGTASTASAEQWRVATLAPDDSAWMKILSRGAEELNKRTDGRVTIKYYAGGVQGDEKDVVAKMQLGQLDGGAMTSVGLSLVDESIRVLELPMLFETVEELDYVRNKMWPTFRARFAKKGYHLGDPGDVGFLYFYSNTPIKSLSDLGKAKVWMWGEDKIVRAMFRKLKVNGVPMGVPDVLPALTSGRINAAYASPLAAVALQWYTKVKYSTSMPMAYGIGATLIKKDKWDKMSAADKKVAKKVLAIQARKLRAAVRKDNKRAFKAITRQGVRVIETPASMVADFEAKAKQVWTEQAGKVHRKADLEKVLKYRDEFRSKQAAK